MLHTYLMYTTSIRIISCIDTERTTCYSYGVVPESFL
jgi:hypothetical protein